MNTPHTIPFIKAMRSTYVSWYTLAAALFLALLTMSCTDMLEEKPMTVVQEQFYNTRDEVEAAVNAIYSPVRSQYAEQIAVLDAHTDWGYGRGSRANYNDFQGFNSTNINNAGTRWNAFYESIRNANLVINNASKGTDISAEDIDLLVSEAKFMRAFNYFSLVRNWGGVPLRTDANLEDNDVKKSTPAEVYAFIIQDALDAEAKLPESPRNSGRPTTYAAKTLLADVYLTMANFNDASAKAAEVMAANKFSLVPATSIQDLQYDLFGPDIVTSKEEIFSLKYARQPDEGNYLVNILNHPSTKLFNFGGAYAHYSDSANPFYFNWNDNDLRKALWDQIDFGISKTTLVSKKYVDQQGISVRGAGNDLPIYRYADVLLIYAEANAHNAEAATPEALEALNKVHRRAYGQAVGAPSAFDFVLEDFDMNTLVDSVLQERAYEFIFEGKRWYDLKRTGTAAQVILDTKGIVVADKHYLWPIPVAEISFNKLMSPADQNPGY